MPETSRNRLSPNSTAPAPKVPSAPGPPSIRSSRRESAHTSSLAREQGEGKEVIRLTPDATSRNGHRPAPAPKLPSAPGPPSIRSSRRESAHTSSLARERRKGKEVIPLTPDATSRHGHRTAPAPKVPSAPGPLSIRSSRRESAHTSSLAREQGKGKEVIRLTPDATSRNGHRPAPAPKLPSAPGPLSIRSSRRESAHTSSLARERRKGKEVIRLTPDATSRNGHRPAPAPKVPSAPGPPSIRSSRRESAHTSSLAREQGEGKEVIRLTPDATSRHGHRPAPAPKEPSAPSPAWVGAMRGAHTELPGGQSAALNRD